MGMCEEDQTSRASSISSWTHRSPSLGPRPDRGGGERQLISGKARPALLKLAQQVGVKGLPGPRWLHVSVSRGRGPLGAPRILRLLSGYVRPPAPRCHCGPLCRWEGSPAWSQPATPQPHSRLSWRSPARCARLTAARPGQVTQGTLGHSVLRGKRPSKTLH